MPAKLGRALAFLAPLTKGVRLARHAASRPHLTAYAQVVVHTIQPLLRGDPAQPPLSAGPSGVLKESLTGVGGRSRMPNARGYLRNHDAAERLAWFAQLLRPGSKAEPLIRRQALLPRRFGIARSCCGGARMIVI